MRTLVAIAVLSAALSTAHANVVKIELSGNLDWGTDYTNVFGYGTNQSLVGKQATLTWLIDLDRLTAPTNRTSTSQEYACGGQLCPSNKMFMSASVSMNGITETLGYQYPYTFNQLGLTEDWDGPAGPAPDMVSLRVGHTRQADDWYQDAAGQWRQFATGLNSSIAVQMKDRTDALLDGFDLNQLGILNYGVFGGASDAGSVVFNVIETNRFYQQVRNAQGVLQLNNTSISWWRPIPEQNGTGGGSTTGGGNATGGTTQTVPEPTSLALFGLGLGLLAARAGRWR